MLLFPCITRRRSTSRAHALQGRRWVDYQGKIMGLVIGLKEGEPRQLVLFSWQNLCIAVGCSMSNPLIFPRRVSFRLRFAASRAAFSLSELDKPLS
jgi:hypothetical protein